jgi:arylsulfatase A-like enzyme
VLPTAAALAGAESPSGIDGVSFVPTLIGHEDRQARREYLYWEFYERGGAQAVRMGDWKGVRKPWGSEAVELYNLKEDLAETHNVADRHPEVAAKVRAAMERAHVPSPLWQVRR